MVSRGYSVHMSILNWLVAFVYLIMTQNSPNILYGLIALIGIVFAHLGTNLFDDFIDFILKVPKQKCKTKYYESGEMSVKQIFLLTSICFFVSLLAGGFFVLKFGLPVLSLIIVTSLIIISYPKLNNYALGELAVGLCFGVLLFMGIGYVMTSTFDKTLILISIPVSFLTVAVLYSHALMDFDFDIKSGKFTLCQLLKTKNNALFGLMWIYILAFIFTVYLIKINVLSYWVLCVILLIYLVFKLYKGLKDYILKTDVDPSDFLRNFKLARNISLFYNLILVISFIIGR